MVREESLNLNLTTWLKQFMFTEMQYIHFKLDINKDPIYSKMITDKLNTSNVMNLLNVYMIHKTAI